MQVRRDRLVAKVLHVGGQPLGLIQQALGHRLVDSRKITHHLRAIGNPVPRHAYHRRPSFSATSSPVRRAEEARDSLSRARIASPSSMPRSGSPRSSRSPSSTMLLTSALNSSTVGADCVMLAVPATT